MHLIIWRGMSTNDKMIQVVVEKKMQFFLNPDKYYYFCSRYIDFYEVSYTSISLSPIFNRVASPPRIYTAEHNNFPIFFLRNNYHISFLRICITNVGLKSHNPVPCVFVHSRIQPPPRAKLHTCKHTQISQRCIYYPPLWVVNPSNPNNTPNPIYWSWLTQPTPCSKNIQSTVHILTRTFSLRLHPVFSCSFIRDYIIISISFVMYCLNVKWNQDE